jgi:CheY-like chemotaxis protein
MSPRSVQIADMHKSAPRILVVDDDEGVRELAVSVLESLGYSVVSAKDGVEALSILDEEDPVDLLFTDIVMPGSLSGYALARRAKAMRPEIKVLYTTGYAAGVLDEIGVLGTTLNKPYRPSQLAAELEAALRG